MKINKFVLGKGELSKRVICSYDFEVFDFTFLYDLEEHFFEGLSYAFLEPEFIKNISFVESRRKIDKEIISKILNISNYNKINVLPNGKNPEFFNEKSLDVLEYQGESGTGHIYYRISKIYNLQKVYDFYENIKQYKDLDYEMFLFLDAQYDFLKQQKQLKNT